jgi:hypothetical protein
MGARETEGSVPGQLWGAGWGPSPRPRMRGWGLGARSRGIFGEGSGPSPPGQKCEDGGTDQGLGARSRGSCGEGPGRNVGMGTGVPVPRAECGPGAAVGRGGVRIPGGAAARSLAGAARPSE